MRTRGGQCGVLSVCAIVATCLASAGLADGVSTWAIGLPAQSTVLTTANLTIGLPADLSATQLASIAVEIDHIDITALAQIHAGAIDDQRSPGTGA